MTGQSIAHYRVTGKLGEGGMGVVYRATDTKLGRDVALKVLPEAFAQDSDRMARFAREAQALAALNHPNIAAIYGLEERALVMELVEGPTLEERIARGPVPLEEALLIARQIVEAFEAAHEKNIVHRDLKPANVKITPEGQVKVLDFGLARVAQESAGDSFDPANSPTLTLSPTRVGMVLGTAAYMAPEQARGAVVDKRADIWAFGAVLYEMLTGKMAFTGESVSDILASVLKFDPDWNALPPSTPSNIRRLLRQCLTKDRKQRLQAIGDARIAIDEPIEVAAATQPAPSRSVIWKALAGALAVCLAVVALLHFRETPPESRLLKYSILPPEKTSFNTFAVSPDGRQLAFAATDSSGSVQLWVRPLDSLTARPLAGTEEATYPFWSPDSRFIGFFAVGKLKKIEASGGPAQTICSAQTGRGGAWNRDGEIVFGTLSGSLFRVAAGGGEAKAISGQGRQGNSHRWPSFLPDGRHFFYWVRSSDKGGIYLGSLDSKDHIRLLGDHSNAVYAGGYLLFARGGSLMAQRFDTAKLQLVGEPIPVTEQVGYVNSSNYATYSVSENGVLVYDATSTSGNSQLTWFDRTGQRLGTEGEPSFQLRPQFSPDEKKLVVDRLDPQAATYDLWLIELARGVSSRFTFDAGIDWFPVWSPDGARIAFASNREGSFNLYAKVSSGAGKEDLLLKSDLPKYPSDWSSDGRFLLYHQSEPKTGQDLWVLPLSGDRKPAPFLRTEFNEVDGSFSPDGKWMAYTSDESGKEEIYVQTFPAAGGKWQVSKGGGSRAKWRRDGKELFYLAADRKLMVVEVKAGATFQAGVPQPLFETRINNAFIRFVPTANGQRFLLAAPMGEARSSPATVVINWTKSIKQ